MMIGENLSVCLREHSVDEQISEWTLRSGIGAGYFMLAAVCSFPSPGISDQNRIMVEDCVVLGSFSGDMKRFINGNNGHVAWTDVRPSRRERIRDIIARLSEPSTIRSIFGPGLTEHAKKYGAPVDLADAVALDRQVDAEYAAREKADTSMKNPGNRRA